MADSEHHNCEIVPFRCNPKVFQTPEVIAKEERLSQIILNYAHLCFIFTKTGEVQEQVVYGITSLAREEITPQTLLQMTRSYWGIENGLHYRRDVTLHEDHPRLTKPKAARVMACLNNLILGLLICRKKYPYLPPARRYFAAHPAQALALFTRL